jgi:hypothetical protein
MNLEEIKTAIEDFLKANSHDFLISAGILRFEIDTRQKKIQGEIVNKKRLKTVKMSKSS